MPKFPFIGEYNKGRSTNADAQETVNLYPEIQERGGKSAIVLHGTPGLNLFTYLSSEPIRGTHVLGSYMYCVAGGKFYRVSAAGVAVEKGTLITSSGRVSMDNNGLEICVVDGTSGYIYNLAGDTFTEIADADFPVADMVTFIDGYFVVNNSATGSFNISGLYDGTAWDALDTATAEAYPDNLVALINDHRELWLFGEYSTEVYYNSGNAAFPFERMQGSVIEKGIAARWSVVKGDNSIFWLAKDTQGQGYVVSANGYQPQVISSRAIEYLISTFTGISDAYGYFYTQEGHSFYVLTFPTGDTTIAYDVTTGMWHRRSSRNQYGEFKRHLGHTYVFFNGRHYVGDYEDGDVYEMKTNVYTDNGEPIVRTRRAMVIAGDGKNQFFHKVQIDMEMGVGDTSYASTTYQFYLADGTYYADGSKMAGGEFLPGASVDPQAMLRWSDDGGHTWGNEHFVSLGKQGEYGKRAIWRRLGKSRQRIFELNISDPVKTTIVDGFIEMTGGRH